MNENPRESLKVVAYLHPVCDRCVTTDHTAYNAPRELVLKTQAQEQIEDLQSGLQQWRAMASEAIALSARLQAAGAASGSVSLSAADMQTIGRLAAWNHFGVQAAQRTQPDSSEDLTPTAHFVMPTTPLTGLEAVTTAGLAAILHRSEKTICRQQYEESNALPPPVPGLRPRIWRLVSIKSWFEQLEAGVPRPAAPTPQPVGAYDPPSPRRGRPRKTAAEKGTNP